jgi:alpha-tubulin suppressor-like RCC1 family protein
MATSDDQPPGQDITQIGPAPPPPPVSFFFHRNRRLIAAGHNTSFAIAPDGGVFAWGKNEFGILGLGDTETRGAVRTPTRIPSLANVVAISGGALHSAFVTGDGQVFTCGSPVEDRMGHLQGGAGGILTTPTAIPGILSAIDVTAGGAATFVILADGGVLVSGRNFYGELGVGHCRSVSTMTRIEKMRTASGGSASAGDLVDMPPVVSVVSHWKCTLFLCQNGQVAAAGVGKCTGFDGIPDMYPRLVPGLRGATDISVNDDFAIAVLDTGQVATWGDGSWAGLGHGATECCLRPRVIEGLVDIVACAAGAHWGALLDSRGQIYTFGLASRYLIHPSYRLRRGYGWLGHGVTQENVLIPRRILLSEGNKEDHGIVVDIQVRETHMLILFADGQIAGTGTGWWGELGRMGGHDGDEVASVPRLIDFR